jgi:hypothetical protein
MDTNFTLDFVNDYIRIQPPRTFEITPESQQRMWTVIGEACRKYNCHRVLAESAFPPKRNMTQIDAFKSASQAANASCDLRLACLYPEYKKDETTEFFINAAYNRGVRIEFFSEREEALEWLIADCTEYVS